MLGHLPAVVGDHRVRGVQDRLRRAVVLLQLDDVGVGIVVGEVEDVLDVRAAEAVDRVVGDEPVGDEVVRVLDVEVVNGKLERHAFDRLDEVERPVLAEHDHAGTHRSRRHERERLAPEARHRANRSGNRHADAVHGLDSAPEVAETGFVTPTGRPARGGTHVETRGGQAGTRVFVTAADGDHMHRSPASSVAAQRESHALATAFEGVVMRMLLRREFAVITREMGVLGSADEATARRRDDLDAHRSRRGSNVSVTRAGRKSPLP